ncbi:MAG: carboxypeptidase-like regulatory domain-containing protein [Terracidiphilus sp.]
MRRPCAAVCTGFAILAFARPAPAQLELITIEQPFDAPNLAGFVVDASGSPIPGVVVEECDASFSPRPMNDPAEKPTPITMLWGCDRDPKHVIASKKTNANGHFSFPRAKKAKAYYLHLSLDGFDPMQIVVKVTRLARSELHIQMQVAT